MKKTGISIFRYVSIYLHFKISTKFIFFMSGELNHFLPLPATPLSIHCSQWYTINVCAANCLGLYVWVKLCKFHFISLPQLVSVSFISSRMTRLLRFYDKFWRINSIPSTYYHTVFLFRSISGVNTKSSSFTGSCRKHCSEHRCVDVSPMYWFDFFVCMPRIRVAQLHHSSLLFFLSFPRMIF